MSIGHIQRRKSQVEHGTEGGMQVKFDGETLTKAAVPSTPALQELQQLNTER